MGLSFLTTRSNNFQTIFLLVLALLLWSGFKSSCTASNEIHEIKVNGKSAYVEIAPTKEKRARGLMHREKLDKDHGMLFIFPQDKSLSFWMKNTKIPLSIAFINSNGVIIQIDSMLPNSLNTHKSKEKVRYALEMEKDWFRKNRIKAGNSISFSPVINNINIE